MCALPLDVPHRPFSTEKLSGIMMPDGFFEAALPEQRLNAQFQNTGGGVVGAVDVYVEGTSHPGVAVTPATHPLSGIAAGGVRVVTWDIDVSTAPPGIHLVSFVADDGSQRKRVIKKIFVTRVQYDPSTEEFVLVAPEGELRLLLKAGLGPHDAKECRPKGGRPNPDIKLTNLIEDAKQLPSIPAGAEVCFPFYLVTEFEVTWHHTVPFGGQYSDMPYADPWWKDLLWVLMVILLIAAIIVAFAAGVVAIVFTGGAAGPAVVVIFNCCAGPAAAATAALLVGGGGSAVAAGLGDERDPFRRGQDNTVPQGNELTVDETVKVKLNYVDPVALGKPYQVQAAWEYTRLTDVGNSYTHNVDEVQKNIHVLSHYDVDAPDVVHLKDGGRWVIEARFYDSDDQLLHGGALFVQCVLEGKGSQQGQYIRLVMQDDGAFPDKNPNDGTYTGQHSFTAKETGDWVLYVFAQDVNTADPSLPPEEAAKIMGGVILTHQLTINYSGGSCPLVPDGHVQVA